MTESESVALPLGDTAIFECSYIIADTFLFVNTFLQKKLLFLTFIFFFDFSAKKAVFSAKNLSFSLTLKGKMYIIILMINCVWRVSYVIFSKKSLDT